MTEQVKPRIKELREVKTDAWRTMYAQASEEDLTYLASITALEDYDSGDPKTRARATSELHRRRLLKDSAAEAIRLQREGDLESNRHENNLLLEEVRQQNNMALEAKRAENNINLANLSHKSDFNKKFFETGSNYLNFSIKILIATNGGAIASLLAFMSHNVEIAAPILPALRSFLTGLMIAVTSSVALFMGYAFRMFPKADQIIQDNDKTKNIISVVFVIFAICTCGLSGHFFTRGIFAATSAFQIIYKNSAVVELERVLKSSLPSHN